MRAGEQFSMKWSQVNFDPATLTLPKTKNARARHIPLNTIALAVFQILKKKVRSGRSGGGFVFRNFRAAATRAARVVRAAGRGSRCRGLHLALQPPHLCQ